MQKTYKPLENFTAEIIKGIISRLMKLAKPKKDGFNLDDARDLVGNDWSEVNLLISNKLKSDVALVNSVSRYIVNSGGKRLRPLLVLLAAKACGYKGDKHILAATIIEFIHTATLLHDDVVDKSSLRRGQKTANEVFGNQASVLVGDFLYSRAFQLMVEIGQLRIMDVLANATNSISEGEVIQLISCNDPETTEREYMEIIYRKTAKLFEAGMVIGAILAGQTRSTEDCMAEYGRQLGVAFQLVDDAFDYGSSTSNLGKNIGDDLTEGKPTLPLIHALERASAKDQVIIRMSILEGGGDKIDEIAEIIKATGSIAYTFKKAEAASIKAINSIKSLPESTFKDSLINLAQFAINREF
ncbi:MAG: polyprenyl synthetase family protein [Pseudomonadota bacterium]|nr:polyprenyl synthetase family protein [Pseudomonadota bacterium]